LKGAQSKRYFANQFEGLRCGINIIIDTYEDFTIGKMHSMSEDLKKRAVICFYLWQNIVQVDKNNL